MWEQSTNIADGELSGSAFRCQTKSTAKRRLKETVPCLHQPLDIPAWPERLNRWKHCDPWRLPFSNKEFLELLGWKAAIDVPPEGWSDVSFAQQGQRLMIVMARTAKIVQRKAVPHIAAIARTLLNKQTEAVVNRVLTSASRYTVEFSFSQHEALWAQAIADVFAEANLEAVVELVPPIQSVMGQGYSKTSILLGQPDDPSGNGTIARRAREIAQKITGINDTTRNVFDRTIRGAITDGLTVTETAERVREKVKGINQSRSMTIARTETSNAWTQGAASSFLESETLTHVSVIGCEKEEPTSPQWMGRSTCNYPDLPITDLTAFLEVNFHPNHTGVIVPTGFR